MESQNIEYKESWHDEYLKWICGYANAEGGILYIGMNDKGKVVGLSNASQLLEVIPNKVRDILGIMVAVNLMESVNGDYLEIIVDSYPSPVSYKGQYHYRSGSTKQELKGAALDRFLLRKQGRTWDSVPVPGVGTKDLSGEAVRQFRDLAKEGRRADAASIQGSINGMVEKLNLTDGKYLKRAAILLFHPDPEKFITGAYVKIGYFRTEAEIAYHDEVRGNLFEQVHKTLDLLQTKYLKAAISYRGIQRIETLPVPPEALREAVLNALIHKDYSSNAPVQIRVYEDKLKIWNSAELPEGWTLDNLLGEHSSRPYNPGVANAFFRAGEIETWGRGIERILSACKDSGSPQPEFRFQANDLWLEFPFSESYLAAIATNSSPTRLNEKVGEKVGENLTENQTKILTILAEKPKTPATTLAEQVGISTRKIEENIRKLKALERLRRIGPAKGGHWEVLQK